MAKQTSKPNSAATLPVNRDDDHLTEYQVEAAFPLTVPWLRAKRLRGVAGDGDAGPPYYKVGRKITYRRGDLRAYMEAHKVDRSKNARP
jgi:hypothetical protein